MAGSLWRQTVAADDKNGAGTGRGVAQQLTAASFDYQPDWSPDGRWVIYSSYRNDAMELWILDLASGAAKPLLANGAVNVEPRFSPDGRRIAFVSTLYNKRFHIFTADIDEGRLTNVERLTGEHQSELPRYYYSPYDHEINPVWTHDGRDIIYVSNRNHIYGTGGFWRTRSQTPSRAAAGADTAAGAATADDAAHEFHYEETNWKARPDVSPDGSRLVYSSYLGRSWHNLWVMPAGGGDAFPISYGDWDETYPRWAPDGTRIAFISNKNGNTEIGRERHAEAHYFHAHGEEWIDVPPGAVNVDILHGFERRFEQRQVTATAGQVADIAVNLDEGTWTVPDAAHWVSADVHVHMNYGGEYRNTPAHLVTQAQAENLSIVNSLLVNKEQRFPDIAYNGKQEDAASQVNALVVHGQEYHTSYWGHLGLLDISGGAILPGYAGYPNSAASSLYPMNADVADIAHARGALVGYVHPFDDYPEPVLKPHETLTMELPVDVALGKVDYMEILGFSDHRSTARVWYQLLNLGFRIPAAGGTDAMANYASLRGPVGMNRVYARVSAGEVKPQEWMAALKAGHSFATNGPLLGFTLGGAEIGDELKFDVAQQRVNFSVRLRSIVSMRPPARSTSPSPGASLVRRTMRDISRRGSIG